MLPGILLALASALCFAAAGALQHSVTSAVAWETAAAREAAATRNVTPARETSAAPETGATRETGTARDVPAAQETGAARETSAARETGAIREVGGGGSLLPVLGMLPRMLSQRVWWAGFACNVGGFVLHSAALHLGSITIVQALLSVQLLFALPIATSRSRTIPLGRDWAGTAAVCAGIVMLVAARGSVPQTQSRHHLVPLICLLGLLLIAALLVTARVARASTRTALIGTAAGTGFSLTAVLIIVVADQALRLGPGLVFASWQVYGLATSGLIAAVLAQDAFASGSFPAALTAMTAADPVVSWFWGAVLFDQVRPATPAALGSLAISGLLITAGVAMLAHSPTMARPAWFASRSVGIYR